MSDGYTAKMRGTLVRISLRQPVAVVVLTILIALAGFAGSTGLDGRLTAITSIPGSASAEADELMTDAFGGGFAGTFVLVVPFGEADADAIAALQSRVGRAVSQLPDLRVVQMRALAGTLYVLIGGDLTLLEASALTPLLRQALATSDLQSALLTGAPALEHDVRGVLADDLRTGAVIGGSLIVLLLLLGFGRSRMIIVPIAGAAAVVGGSLLAVWLLTFVVPMVLYVPSVVELVGLGLAIDYGLLIVHRLRTERPHHANLRSSVTAAFETSGRTVWWAGITVAISLATLLVVPVPFIRSLAIAGVVVPLVAMLVAHTLIPAVIILIGDHVGNGGFLGRLPRLPGLVVRKPRMVLTIGIGGLLVLATPIASMNVAPASLTAIPPDVPAMQAVRYLQERIGPGAVTPHELVIDVGQSDATSVTNDDARERFATWLGDQRAVFGVFSESTANYVDTSSRYQRIFVIGRDDFAAEGTQAFVGELRNLDLERFGYRDAILYVGGTPAQGTDFLAALRLWVPALMGILLLVAGMILFRLLRSGWLAWLSIGLNLVTLAAVIGLLTWVFQRSEDDRLSVLMPVPALESWALLVLGVLLFGITLDYQLFVLTRIRERFQTGTDVVEAVQAGVGDTGGVIMLAATAVVGALSGLIIGQVAGLQELGLGLALGVILDATVVRLILLPAIIVIFRHRIWNSSSIVD